MGKVLILTPDDTIESKDYVNYKTIEEVVCGVFSACGHNEIPAIGRSLPVTLFCNDEFLIREDEQFDKVNAVASLLCGQEIRGNVMIGVDEPKPDGIATRGFRYTEILDGNEIVEDICEHWMAEDVLLRFIEQNKEALQQLHRQFDGHKSEPVIRFETFERE